MTNSSKPAATLMPHVRSTRLRFLLSKRWEKIHSGDRGKKKKRTGGDNMAVSLLKVSLAAL